MKRFVRHITPWEPDSIIDYSTVLDNLHSGVLVRPTSSFAGLVFSLWVFTHYWGQRWQTITKVSTALCVVRHPFPHDFPQYTMQPSEYEIQREVETLRDIRRRSTAQGGPGSLIIDPDLPGASSQSSSSAYYDPSNEAAYPEDADPDVVLAGDPSHLFWVPARLHPEIAPAEFRQFLKEHAHTPADASGSAPISRSSSISSVGLGRKKSMLSRQYKPSENDGVENEQILPIRRNRSSVYNNPGPQLTINDLQKIEELAEEASRSHDPSKLRSVLRRSLSLNISPTGGFLYLPG